MKMCIISDYSVSEEFDRLKITLYFIEEIAFELDDWQHMRSSLLCCIVKEPFNSCQH